MSLKKSTGFSHMSVTPSCCVLFALLRNNLQIGAEQHVNGCFFANIDVFFYWLAQIIGTYIIDLLSRA